MHQYIHQYIHICICIYTRSTHVYIYIVKYVYIYLNMIYVILYMSICKKIFVFYCIWIFRYNILHMIFFISYILCHIFFIIFYILYTIYSIFCTMHYMYFVSKCKVRVNKGRVVGNPSHSSPHFASQDCRCFRSGLRLAFKNLYPVAASEEIRSIFGNIWTKIVMLVMVSWPKRISRWTDEALVKS